MSSILVRCGRVSLLVLFVLSSSACLVRHRVVAPAGKPETRPLLKATKAELLARVHAVSDPVQSFTMKVDMAPSVGNLYGGAVTDYPTITGYIIYKRPDEIRVIGLDPVVHSTILDMVSMANDFRVSLPTKNQFIEGANDAPATSQNKLENLRPVAFLNSLLIDPPSPGDMPVLVDDTNETKAVYILMMLNRNGDELSLRRNIYFDRYTLNISRQKTFDKNGYITSDTKYSKWLTYDAIRFPGSIDIQRPQDGYELVLTLTELKLNTQDVTAEKFALNPPPTAQVRMLK